ncbi:hypothetical protein C0U43_28890, partial [Klebsiella pneumoniae]
LGTQRRLALRHAPDDGGRDSVRLAQVTGNQRLQRLGTQRRLALRHAPDDGGRDSVRLAQVTGNQRLQ